MLGLLRLLFPLVFCEAWNAMDVMRSIGLHDDGPLGLAILGRRASLACQLRAEEVVSLMLSRHVLNGLAQVQERSR